MIQAYLLYFDIEKSKIQADVVRLNDETSDTLEQTLGDALQSESYEFNDYSDEITIIVDNRGFEKANNPVFNIVSTYGDVMQLAGRLLFVRNVENEFSTDIGSIKYEDIFNLRLNLEIKLIGMTKGLN
ncbi:MAG: hypothetical protein ABS948_16700 [Solibacillus sp.]